MMTTGFGNNNNNLSVFMPSVQLDYFIVSETKLKNTFPSTQFMFTDYETRVRWDGNKNVDGLI